MEDRKKEEEEEEEKEEEEEEEEGREGGSEERGDRWTEGGRDPSQPTFLTTSIPSCLTKYLSLSLSLHPCIILKYIFPLTSIPDPTLEDRLYPRFDSNNCYSSHLDTLSTKIIE